MAHEPDFNELTAFVERRLTLSEQQRVVAHLSTCRACRDVVAALSAVAEHVPAATLPHWRRMPGLLSLAALLVLVVIAGLFSVRPRPAPAPQPPPATDAPSIPPASPPQQPSAPQPAPPLTPPKSADDLQRTRGAQRSVGGKTFQFVSGEWVDASYDPQQALPVIEATTPAEREALLRDVPALKAFSSLGGRIVVVVEGTVYRF